MHVEVRPSIRVHVRPSIHRVAAAHVAVAVFASVHLALPDIPYIIAVTTTSAPLAREKAQADKSKGTASPRPPRDPHDLEFELEQRLQLRADIFKGKESKAAGAVATILGGKKEMGKDAPTKIDIEPPERECIPLGAALVSGGKEKEKETERTVRARARPRERSAQRPSRRSG